MALEYFLVDDGENYVIKFSKTSLEKQLLFKKTQKCLIFKRPSLGLYQRLKRCIVFSIQLMQIFEKSHKTINKMSFIMCTIWLNDKAKLKYMKINHSKTGHNQIWKSWLSEVWKVSNKIHRQCRITKNGHWNNPH